MRRNRLRVLAALALACAGAASHAVAVPLLGNLEVSFAWSPGNPAVNTTVTFTASASDNDGTIRSSTMCFSDGSSCVTYTEATSEISLATACLAGDNWSRQWQHKFTRTGPFRVTLTVYSRGCPGAGDETRTITGTVSVS